MNIHHFRDDGWSSNEAPIEKVVVFDKAQMTWTQEQQVTSYDKKKACERF